MKKPCAVFAIAAMLAGSMIASAEDHLVSRKSVDARLAEVAAERTRNLESLDEVLDSAGARKAAARAGVDIEQVRQALPLLSDSELRDLSQRAADLKSDPVAGYHYESAHALVFILLFAAVLLVLLQVAHY